MKRHTIFDQTVLIVFYGIHCRPFGTIALTKKANLLHFMISCSITLGYKETCCLKVLLLEKKIYIYIYISIHVAQKIVFLLYLPKLGQITGFNF